MGNTRTGDLMRATKDSWTMKNPKCPECGGEMKEVGVLERNIIRNVSLYQCPKDKTVVIT